MNELMSRLSTQFEIPLEHLKIFKRRAIGQGQNVEELSIAKNLERKLKILRVNDGLNLFIENGSFLHPDIESYAFLSKENTVNKWETEFELDRNRFTIKFNIPAAEALSKQSEEKNQQVDVNIDY